MAQKNEGQSLTPTLAGNLILEEANGRLTLHDGTVFRMIIGILPDGTVGIAISKVGKDVFNAFS